MNDFSALPVPYGLAASLSLISSSVIRSFDGGERCGDVALVLPLPAGRTALVVVDVAGHGAARAPIAAGLVAEITASLVLDRSPSVALARADEHLCACADESPYAVAFVALVDTALRTVVYASAGLDLAFTLADDGRIRQLSPTAAMLGIALADRACDAAFTLGANETLVIATDGISDSRPAGSCDFFGAERTAYAIARSRREGRNPALAVLEAALAHEGGTQADDDAVIVARVQTVQQHRNVLKEIVHVSDPHRHSGPYLALGA